MDPFDAIADPVRRRLLARLRRSPLTAGELAGTEEISRPAVSRHLRLLEQSGLVTVDASGRTRTYRLAPDGLGPVQQFLTALQEPRPPIPADAFDALDLEVRRTTRDLASPTHASPTRQEHIA